jgi:hypothetical protein
MNSILPIFVAGCFWVALALPCRGQALPVAAPAGQPAAAPNAAPPDSNSGDALLHHVLETVDAQPSIAAKVRHRVELLGRPLLGTGIYLQQGRGAKRRVRLDLELHMAGQAAHWRQVSDGENFWLYEELDEVKKLGWVDVSRVARARPKGQASPPAAAALSALGGLPRMLDSIAGSFRFGTVGESRLEDLSVFSIEGQWKQTLLAHFLPEQKEAIEAGKSADLTKLPANFPDRVIIHVGSDDFFPYRIEYWRADSGVGEGADHLGRLILLVEFYEVRLGGAIDAGQFAFERGKLEPLDRTQEFLDKLGLEETVASGAAAKRPPRR